MDDTEPISKIPKLEPINIEDIVKFEVVHDNGGDFQNVKEEILTEDDNNIVGIISQFDDTKDALEEDLDDPGIPGVDVKVKIEEQNQLISTYDVANRGPAKKKTRLEEEEIDLKTAFTDQEDLALHALDLISPYDLNFISSHLSKRMEKSIERRLDDNEFRKKSFLFHKIPSFLFGLVFTNNKVLKFRSLVLISENHIANLICAQKTCEHGPDIVEMTAEYDGKAKLGVDVNPFVEFINENAPERFREALTMTADRLEKLFVDSKFSFHRYGTSIGYVNAKTKKPKAQTKIQKKESPMYLNNNELTLTDEHKETLVKIISATGKTRWELVLILMHEIFGKTKPGNIQAKKLENILREYYMNEVDPDRFNGPFTEDEDKCLLFLYKHFNQFYNGNLNLVWKSVSRHMAGRSQEECKERLLRKSSSKDELTLDNLDLEDIHDDVPSLFYYNECHVFALTVIPKNVQQDLDIPTKLQQESRFLVAGTLEEIFILPCKETALRCSHHGFTTMNFTYNPAKPDSQFETYLKLTFSNQLKRVGLIDEDLAKNFNFSQINYKGKGIHELIDSIEKTRFIVPRDHFVAVNQKEDEKVTGGKRGFCNERYYKMPEEN